MVVGDLMPQLNIRCKEEKISGGGGLRENAVFNIDFRKVSDIFHTAHDKKHFSK